MAFEEGSSLSGSIEAISFDLDDTLWDCTATLVRADARIYAWLAQRVPMLTDRYDPQALADCRMQFITAHPELHSDMTALRIAFLRSMIGEQGYPLPEAEKLANEAFEVFYQARNTVIWYADSLQSLENLAKQFKLAAITNGNADLALVGVDHLFSDFRRASLDVTPKPARDMFDQCAAALGLAPERILHVGDNPQIDVVGAQKAGYATAWFNHGGEETWPADLRPADLEIHSLSELVDVLQSI